MKILIIKIIKKSEPKLLLKMKLKMTIQMKTKKILMKLKMEKIHKKKRIFKMKNILMRKKI